MHVTVDRGTPYPCSCGASFWVFGHPDGSARAVVQHGDGEAVKVVPVFATDEHNERVLVLIGLWLQAVHLYEVTGRPLGVPA